VKNGKRTYKINYVQGEKQQKPTPEGGLQEHRGHRVMYLLEQANGVYKRL